MQVFASGERFPLLIDVRTGIPVFDVTAFTLSEFRQVSRASATLEQVVRSCKVWLLFGDDHGVDLYARMREGLFLTMGELDALIEMCNEPLEAIESRVCAALPRSAPQSRKVTSLEAHRARASAQPQSVINRDSAGIRIRYIHKFLEWLSNRHHLAVTGSHSPRPAFLSARDTVLSAMKARIPDGRGRNAQGGRLALLPDIQDRLWEVVVTGSPENPWTRHETQVRNELIIRWFMGLGLRPGELRGARVQDVDLRKNELFIARRADDIEDPRAAEPNTKTNDRLVPLSVEQARLTRHYIFDVRRNYPKARKHPFLFVATGGEPLSKSGLYRIFVVLCERHPELGPIFPYLLRHTWNDNFSNEVDEKKIPPEREQKVRAKLMGWKPTSKTASTYDKRHTDREARAVSLSLQEKMELPADAED
ncbi:tyrosine-type recombinase/integrase [Paraburkholderia sp. HP33-1]|uniref:tyrosine-type recombinase/integrase n=1 Tax=Paraburkholderia sp. HP33-1 TaxID=2883243 RepID=UPI001F1DDF32|nr:tyrosine-type recombinase/integrase [Paraburkholderia sp. HP33-1]